MTAELYLYSEPVHNVHYYWQWFMYYCQYTGVFGWISVGLWAKVHKTIKGGL